MKWYEHMIETSKGFIRRGQTVSPVLFLMSDQGSLSIVSLSAFADNKEAMSAAMRWLIRKRNPAEYCFITESYVKMLKVDDEGDQALGSLLVDGSIQVSQLPSSQEALTVLHGTRRSERFGFIPFTKQGGKVTFGKTRWLGGDELKGRFVNLRNE